MVCGMHSLLFVCVGSTGLQRSGGKQERLTKTDVQPNVAGVLVTHS